MEFLSFCSDSAKLWKLIGRVMLVFKIVIPLLLIIFGMIDLGKAVIASDEKAIKAATNSIIRRLIAAVVIFFIPTIVSAIFGLVDSFSDTDEGYKICRTCITKPGSCDTSAAVD